MGSAGNQGSENWGDPLKNHLRSRQSIRFCFLNIGGFPHSKHIPKMLHFKKLVETNSIDIIGLAETNTQWHRVHVSKRPFETLFGWFNHNPRIMLSYFHHSPVPGAHVFGGTGLFAFGQAKDRSRESGSDFRGLGRWTWTRIHGKAGFSVRFVSAYRPVPAPNAPRSVWSQQRTYFDDHDIDDDPRALFLTDLLQEIQAWKQSGDHLVIGVDMNETISSPHLLRSFQQAGLTDILSHRHDSPPPTSMRGSSQIDALYVTPALLGSHCGALPLGAFDHRPLWIDIPHQLALGTDLDKLPSPSCRRLRCDDPRTVARFHEQLRMSIAEANIFSRLVALSNSLQGSLNRDQIDAFECLKSDHHRAVLQAEKKCRKLRMGAIPYTPTYSRARYTVLYWQSVIRLTQKKRVSRRFLSRTAKKAGITVRHNEWVFTIAQDRLQKARSHLRKLSFPKTAALNREDYLHSLAAAKARHGLMDAEFYLRQLVLREKARRQGRLLRRVNHKLRSGAVSMVVGPPRDPTTGAFDPHGHWLAYTSKDDIEQACLWENERRFRQAHGTPPTVPPLFPLLGNTGTTDACREILQGSIQFPPGIDPWAIKLLRHFAYLPEVSEGHRVPLDISLDQWRHAWLKSRENTSAGPSGYSFAHFKANSLPGAEDLARIDLLFARIPFLTGYSPTLWQRGINCMLEKKKGNFRVDKLRAILVYEAEFNMINKIIGREAMKNAERLNGVAWEQYGCRKEHSAVNQGLNKTLTCDIGRQRKQPFAICSNDAKSCFDRIVHSIASLSLQRVGYPIEPLICVFTTIRHLEHRIRTVYGDSDSGFCGRLWAAPIQGIGQGNGAGPQIWALVSTPVLNMLRAEGYGAFFRTAISGDHVSFVGYSFVDDTDLIVAHPDLTTSADVHSAMQGSINAWEGGIRSTGGAIVPEKSFWYLLDFKWKQGKWRYSTLAETPGSLTVRDLHGTERILRRLHHFEAERTLGVYISPDGNMATQARILRSKATAWAEMTRTGLIPRWLVWESFRSTITRSLHYPLAATTLTQAQCTSIMAPVKQVALSGSGIVRSFPSSLAYAPQLSGGLDMPDLYVTQGIDHLQRLVSFYHCPDDLTGSLLRTSLELLTLELGFNFPLSASYPRWQGCATPGWFKHTWKFLHSFRITCLPDCDLLQVRREQDCFLMTALPPQVPSGDLAAFNRCRLFHQVVTVSDVTDGHDGRPFRAFTRPFRTSHWAAERYDWPNQGKPSVKDWSIWNRLLSLLCSTVGPRLGPWLSSAVAPSARFSPRFESLYLLCPTSRRYKLASRIPGRPTRQARMRFNTATARLAQLPPDSIPASIYFQGSTAHLLSSMGLSLVSSPSPSFGSCDADALWALQSLDLVNLPQLLCYARAGHALIGVSDGSFKTARGAAAWTIRVPGIPHSTISGCCNCPGLPSSTHSAYRAELAGLYGLLVASHRLEACLDGPVSVTFMCDGLSALNQADQLSLRVSPDRDHFDLIGACRRLRSELRGSVSFQHVQGHADSRGQARPLTEPELLNVWCDDQAKSYLAMLLSRQIAAPQRIWREPCPILLSGVKLSVDWRLTLRDSISGTPGRAYWCKTFGVSEQEIDWPSLGRALRSSPLSRRVFFLKHSSERAAVGTELVRRKTHLDSSCPRCSEPFETCLHSLRCVGGSSVWKASLCRLKKWLLPTTSSLITATIISNLEAWFSLSPAPEPPSRSTSLLAACSQQNWSCFTLGFLSPHWLATQTLYLQSIGSRKSPRRWTSMLIQKLWDTCWDMWNHRCGILHHVSSGARAASLRESLADLLSSLPDSLPPRDRPLLRTTLPRLLSLPLDSQAAWVTRVRSAQQRHRRRLSAQRRTFIRERAFMEAFVGIKPS